MKKRVAIGVACTLTAYAGLYVAARASHVLIERYDVWGNGSEGGGMFRSISRGYQWVWQPKWGHALADMSYHVFTPLRKMEEEVRSLLDPLPHEIDVNDLTKRAPNQTNGH